jgi:hypothetical protein
MDTTEWGKEPENVQHIAQQLALQMIELCNTSRISTLHHAEFTRRAMSALHGVWCQFVSPPSQVNTLFKSLPLPAPQPHTCTVGIVSQDQESTPHKSRTPFC